MTRCSSKQYVSDLAWIEKNRQPRDLATALKLKEVFDHTRKEKKLHVGWKWLHAHYLQAYKETHGKKREKRPSGNLISKFVSRNKIRMRKRKNKKDKAVEERRPLIHQHLRGIHEIRTSIRADNPQQPRDPESIFDHFG